MKTIKAWLFWIVAGALLTLAAYFPMQTLAISSVIAIWLYIDQPLPKESK